MDRIQALYYNRFIQKKSQQRVKKIRVQSDEKHAVFFI